MEAKTEEKPAAEKTIFDAIAQNDLVEFKNILAQHKGPVDFFDENGMTALQHAAYKGNKDMVQLLLDRVRSFHWQFWRTLIVLLPILICQLVFPGSRC